MRLGGFGVSPGSSITLLRLLRAVHPDLGLCFMYVEIHTRTCTDRMLECLLLPHAVSPNLPKLTLMLVVVVTSAMMIGTAAVVGLHLLTISIRIFRIVIAPSASAALALTPVQ